MSESLNRKLSSYRSWLRFTFCFVLVAAITMLLSYPFMHNSILALEISLYVAMLFTLSIIGCSIEYRHRTLFMFHYHGTRTIVMDELTQEMSED
jgi:hypothetical protein